MASVESTVSGEEPAFSLAMTQKTKVHCVDIPQYDIPVMYTSYTRYVASVWNSRWEP